MTQLLTVEDALDLELDALLSVKDLRRHVPVSHTQISRMVAAGQFPPPIYLGARPFWPRNRFQRWLEYIVKGCTAEEAVRLIS